MNIIIGQHPTIAQGSAVTIGNFDGVHQGHLHILQKLKQQAQQRGLASTAIVFEPQPTEYFAQQRCADLPYRLTPLRDKIALLQQSQCLDTVWIQRFNHEFANQDAQTFIDHILLGNLNTRYLLVGDDFRFGKGRGGDFELLCAQTAFVTERTDSVLVSGNRASSTAVRQALASGDLAHATHILGHPYTLSGHVKHGKKLGRTIGAPTANVHLPAHRYALSGVFVVRVSGRFGEYGGVASFGVNPTVSQTPDAKLEVHLFDFNDNIYGERICVRFLHKLRDEVKFNNLDELQAQIAQDMEDGRLFLKGFLNI